MMRMLFGFMIMLRLAIGSCMECKMVDANESGDASLEFTTSGLTYFYEIHCEERRNRTRIGQYCGPTDNCSTKGTTGVSIETGHLIVYNVTYNRCYSAIPDKNTPGNETCYNVTVNKIPSQSTGLFGLPREVVFGVIAFVIVVVAIGLFAVWYKRRQRYKPVNTNISAQGSHEEINIGTPEAANSVLVTVNETQL